MIYVYWDMVCDRQTEMDGQKKWHIAVGAPPKKFVLKDNVAIKYIE